ncbi:MAG: MBL fold metallo-hydrolase, partial [Chloroflexi bacterium]|nr:MBL fold metallo-hydrolase [Chloroflexota bacterium]
EKRTHLLRVGTKRVDGGGLFGAIPKERWETFISPDRHNRVAFGNYCALFPCEEGWVLVDTGPGDAPPPKADVMATRGRSSLLRDLRELGINPRDIAMVVLTHLHTEHAGGATHSTDAGRLLPTFPRARYVVQEAAWEEACHPDERNMHLYDPEQLHPLLEMEQIELIDGEREVVPGVWARPAPGPTNGHQIVLAEWAGGMMAFLGLLTPTLMHLTSQVVSAADKSPENSMISKEAVLAKAVAEDWFVAPVGFDGWVAGSDLDRLLTQQPIDMGNVATVTKRLTLAAAS